MASKQQELRTNIVLGGKVDSSLNALSAKLNEFNSLASTISRKIIQVGKESVEQYIGYEEAMKEVYALGNYTYSDMEKLHRYNKEIAQTTTYTNTEAAQAELLLAQAGLDIEKTYQVLPSVMNLAMAGNLDMADSVDYLVSSLNSLGLGMDSAGKLTDQMAKTAALGMTDIDTLGESLMRLGSASGLYFENSTEVLTILSAMSQFGQDMRGAQAGTMLRNFALALAAPTSNVEELSEAMRELGESEEDIEEVIAGRSNGAAAKAVGILEEAGLQIYDAQGNLLPMIDIIKSLRNAVKGNGDYTKDLEQFASAFASAGEDVDTFVNATDGLSNNALFTLMSQIFGKRGATTALNLISISDEEWDSTYQEIENSAGFAEDAAETMQGGLSGSLEKLDAAFSELKSTLGEYLAPDVKNVADFLHGIVVDVSNFDSDTWSLIVSGVEGFAGASLGVSAVAGALKIIASLGTVGRLGLVFAGLSGAVAALNKLDEIDFANQFGDLDLSSEGMTAYIDSLGSSFDTAYQNVKNYNTAMSTAVSTYSSTAATFKTDLISKMLTQSTLTEADIASLESLGDTMYQSILDGIANATAADMETITQAFGGQELAEENSTWAEIIEVIGIGYDAAVEQAKTLSEELRSAMTSAFEDGKLSGEEVQNIQSILDEMNEVLAYQTSAEDYATQQSMLRKAQTMGLDSLQELSQQELERQNQVMEDLYSAQDTAYGRAKASYQYMIDNGMTLTDANGNEFAVTQEYADQQLAILKQRQELEAAGYHLNFLPFVQSLYEEAIGSSDLSDSWTALGEFADAVMGSGGIASAASVGAYQSSVGAKERSRLSEYMGWYINALGGEDALQSDINALLEQGNTEGANALKRILQMSALANDYLQPYEAGLNVRTGGESAIGEEYSVSDVRRQFKATEDEMLAFSIQEFKDALESGDTYGFLNLMNSADVTDTGFKSAWENAISLLSALDGWNEIEVPKGMQSISDYYKAYQMMYPATVQELTVTDNGEGEALRSELESTFSSPITQSVYVSTVSGSVWGSGTSNYVGSSSGTGKARAKYAEGGRADTASIFGEAGPEWAIPEEHSRRTADLLNAARAASGFTWPELLAETGGLNAGNSRSVTLTYSPTIIANDATDVEAKLLQDKSRLERWMRDKQIRDEVEVYA